MMDVIVKLQHAVNKEAYAIRCYLGFKMNLLGHSWTISWKKVFSRFYFVRMKLQGNPLLIISSQQIRKNTGTVFLY